MPLPTKAQNDAVKAQAYRAAQQIRESVEQGGMDCLTDDKKEQAIWDLLDIIEILEPEKA